VISHLSFVSSKKQTTYTKLGKYFVILGCYEAMNLDGGASKALAANSKILVPAGRPLTNVIVVYDAKNPAPNALQQAWVKFQKGDRPMIPGG
jgi:Phosphodiester glycosidase